MLIEREAAIADQDLICLVHIPKTGGSTVKVALHGALGNGPLREFLPEPIESLETGLRLAHLRLRRRLLSTQRMLEQEARRLWGRPNGSLHHARVASGHMCLTSMPKISRPTHYVTMVREPIDRLASMYFYLREKALRKGRSPRASDKQLALSENFAAYAQALLAGDTRLIANPQCRYLHPSGNPEAAIAAIDDKIFLAAPTDRLPDFLAQMAECTSSPIKSDVYSNRSRLRAHTPNIDPKLRDRLNAVYDGDRRLHEHVARVFDDLVSHRRRVSA